MAERERLHRLVLNRRRFLAGSAAAAASAVLAACGGTGTAPTATSGGTPSRTAPTTGVASAAPSLSTTAKNPPQGKPQGNKPSELVMAWGVNQLTAHGLDPQTHVNTVAESQLRHLYEPLVKIERDAKTISPVLATEWKRLDDNTMQFKLRQGVKFHNGEEFDAESVKYSILRPLDPKNNADARTTYSVIDRVDAVDKYTVNIHTAKPDPVLLLRMTGFSMVQVAPKWTEANAVNGAMKDANGTGPYKLKSWAPQQDLVVEANEQYWGGAPPIKAVRMKTITELSTRVAALRSGEVHIAKDVPPEEADSLNKGGRQTARVEVSNRVPFYLMEVRKPPLDNVKLRQAVNYAVDWADVIQSALLGNGTRVSTVLPPWTIGYDPGLKPYPYDPEKAKSLMKEAGVGNGFDLNVYRFQGLYMKDKEIGEVIVQQLNKAGIRAKDQLLDSSVLLQEDLARDLDGLMFTAWGNWIFDADNTFYPIFSTEARDTSNGGKGSSRRAYGNPEFNQLITDARYTLDPQKRNELYARAQKVFFDDAPCLFMYQLMDIYGVDNWVQWNPRHDEMVWAYEMKWNE
ncbi:MAG: ABC transporter substrate-binding protein [Gemmatimonadaceae bacterium]